MTTKEKIKRYLIGLALALAAILGLGNAVLAESDTAREAVARALAGHLERHPNDQLAILLAQYLVKGDNPLGETLGAVETRQGPQTNFSQTCLKDDVRSGVVCSFYKELSIPTSTTTVVILGTNERDRPVYLDSVELNVLGTVSSSFKGFSGTSTVQSPAFDAATPPNSLINGALFVTSTVTRLEFAVDAATSSYRSSLDSALSGTPRPVFVASSTNVLGFVQANDRLKCGSTGSACEQVTSTNRGWSGFFRVRGHYFLDQ